MEAKLAAVHKLICKASFDISFMLIRRKFYPARANDSIQKLKQAITHLQDLTKQ